MTHKRETSIPVRMICAARGQTLTCSICHKEVDTYVIRVEGEDKTIDICYICEADTHSATMYDTYCVKGERPVPARFGV
jgi:hypothetical protein